MFQYSSFQCNDDDGDGGEKENYDHCGKLLGATQANGTLDFMASWHKVLNGTKEYKGAQNEQHTSHEKAGKETKQIKLKTN